MKQVNETQLNISSRKISIDMKKEAKTVKETQILKIHICGLSEEYFFY